MTLTNDDLRAISDLLDTKLDAKLDARFDQIDNRFNRIEIRLDKVESETSSLKSGQLELRKELREINHKVSQTYDLALEAWGNSTENRVWLETSNLKMQ